jgi:hypothetical protein
VGPEATLRRELALRTAAFAGLLAAEIVVQIPARAAFFRSPWPQPIVYASWLSLAAVTAIVSLATALVDRRASPSWAGAFATSLATVGSMAVLSLLASGGIPDTYVGSAFPDVVLRTEETLRRWCAAPLFHANMYVLMALPLVVFERFHRRGLSTTREILLVALVASALGAPGVVWWYGHQEFSYSEVLPGGGRLKTTVEIHPEFHLRMIVGPTLLALPLAARLARAVEARLSETPPAPPT